MQTQHKERNFNPNESGSQKPDTNANNNNCLIKKCIHILKRETVLAIAWLLAVISAFFVHPNAGYVDYIDFHTLCLLFALMGVMAGYKKTGLFERIAQALLGKVTSIRQLELLLILLCFFSSMVMTNDVALITFVPLAIGTLKLAGKSELMIPVIVMQTIAANLGSMQTPIGNPQNLYLFSKSGISVAEFILLMLPYTLAALALICIWQMLQKNQQMTFVSQKETRVLDKKPMIIYTILFIVCLLSVAKVLSAQMAALIVLMALLIYDRSILPNIDYSLLLTFVGFFIFIGNIGEIPAFSEFIAHILKGSETVIAILLSQCISNVPAALLLSGFTDQIHALIIGTNLGGLGTIIASMASLISFKYFSAEMPSGKKSYMIYFTGANIIFLLLLMIVFFFVS